jgi:hypothetical protein
VKKTPQNGEKDHHTKYSCQYLLGGDQRAVVVVGLWRQKVDERLEQLHQALANLQTVHAGHFCQCFGRGLLAALVLLRVLLGLGRDCRQRTRPFGPKEQNELIRRNFGFQMGETHG